MKRRQETVTEGDWNGEFESYSDWAKLGPEPSYRMLPFSMLKADVASLRKISRGHATKGISGEVSLGTERTTKASLGTDREPAAIGMIGTAL